LKIENEKLKIVLKLYVKSVLQFLIFHFQLLIIFLKKK